MKKKKHSDINDVSNLKGLNHSAKIIMFFFGFVIVFLQGGNRYFYHLPGNEKQKRQTIFYYILGVIFWILTIPLIFYIVDKFIL